MDEPNRRWSAFTKRAVILIILVLLALMVYRFRDVLPPLMIAFLLAFVLSPIVGFLADRLRLSRGLATAIVFLLLIAGMLGVVVAAPVSAVQNVVRAVRDTQFDTIRIINDLGAFFERPVEIGDYVLDLSDVYQELSAMLTSFVASVAEGTLDVVFDLASGAFWLIVILMTTFYLVKDVDRFTEQLYNLAPPGYRDDVVRLRQQITDVWNAFLRGQLVMGLVMMVITTVVCTAVGLPYAVVMGLVAGVTEFIPNLGPILALVPAVLVALFTGSSFLPLSNFWFAVLVLGLYLVIQQVEGNLILPRVMGSSLNLHPLMVLIGIIIGGSMAGILGMLLAAPVLATLRVIGYYVFCRLYDRDPFAKLEEEAKPSQPGLVKRAGRAAWYRLWEKLEQRKEQSSEKSQVQIRPARATDKPAVEAICAQIWEGEDYIPEMWDEWLADPHGQLAVAELAGQIVGFAKLGRLADDGSTELADDEWWLEGLRVDPAHRRKGIAGQLQAHLVELTHRIGRGTLRLGTRSLNEPVHRLAARDSFRHVATYRRYRADPLPATDAPPPRQLTEADLPAAWALVNDSPRYQAAGGLYEDFWTWKNLTRDRLARHLAAGDVWGLDAYAELTSLAMICRTEGENAIDIGYVDGTEEALTSILQGLRGLAAQRGQTDVRVKSVDEPVLIAAVEAAGYERYRDHTLCIFELELEEGESDGRKTA
jgi:predicted PurR-regulated permease PerM/GNAT superfamily N-acetyltransferase